MLALTVHNSSMLALCFTEPASRLHTQRSPLTQEGSLDDPDDSAPHSPNNTESDFEFKPATVPSTDDSFMEIFQLDLNTYTWTRLDATGQVPPGRYGCSATVTTDGRAWIIHGGISRNYGCPIFADTFSFDFETSTWTELECEERDGCIPRTGHVGAASCFPGGEIASYHSYIIHRML